MRYGRDRGCIWLRIGYRYFLLKNTRMFPLYGYPQRTLFGWFFTSHRVFVPEPE